MSPVGTNRPERYIKNQLIEVPLYMSKNKIAICIPVHGWSVVLEETLESIRNSEGIIGGNIDIIISNSGVDFLLKNGKDCIFIKINDDDYWVGAVSKLYEYCNKNGYDYVYLMNHDCLVDKLCLANLYEFCKNNTNTVAHSVVLYRDSVNKIWWAGSKIKCLMGLYLMYKDKDKSELPPFPYEIDSAMGQCLLLPIKALKKHYLHEAKFQHYFGDSVQTCEMKRDGYKIFIVPNAISYTDQTDDERKQSLIRPDTIKDLYRIWTAPYSGRNLKATYYSSIYHQNCVIGKIIYPMYRVLLQIAKPVFQYLIIKATGVYIK